MIHNYLTPKNIFSRYEESKRHTELLTEPFPEFERIARNRPHDNIDSKLPRTTDGTTASIIRKTSKRVVQQLPTGVIESDDDNAWLPIIAQFIFTNKILKYANEDYDLIQKCWSVIESGLTFGAKATYTPFLNHDGYFCTDLTLPYWGDVFLQKGKKSGYACSYVFMRSWWQEEDIDALIKREKKLAKDAKARGDKYESTWDLKALESVKKQKALKDEKARTPSENERSTNPEGIEMVTGFQKGIGATFYTFVPGAKEIVRTKKNKDPRGKIPIDWMYGDIDGTNPLGRGVVELVGGLQNLIDSDMQMYQYNRALMLAPPVIKRGSFNKKKIVFEPNRVIDMGNDPNAMVDTLKIDTSAVINYPQLYGLQKSQLLNLVNSPDTSISADVGNPGFSKTPQGIKQQQATISVDDNYVRKMFEKWFENWAETAINLFFAERSGKEELQLDNETAAKLRELEEKGKLEPGFVNENNVVIIDYDSATPALKFCVDASTSKMKDDQEQLIALQGLLETLQNSPILQSIVPKDKIIGAWNAIVAASGVEDPEALKVTDEDLEAQAQQPQPPSEEEIKAQQENVKLEQENVKLAQDQIQLQQDQVQLQREVRQESQMEQQIVAQLRELGFGDQTIAEAVQMLNNGYTGEQVFQALTQGVVNA